MTIIAQFTIEGEQSDVDQVLSDFHEDDLVLWETTEHHNPTSDRQMFEVQTDEGEMLSQFHETCIEQQVIPTIHRIHHKTRENPLNKPVKES